VASLGLGNGFTGVFSLGHVGFVGVGAYVSGILSLPATAKAAYLSHLPGWLAHWSLPFLPATLFAGLVAMLLALLVGAPLMRLSGHFVSVATPNHTHFEIAKTFAEAGFNVVCDKPMTFDLAQAEELMKVVEKSGVVFAVSHNYTGNPLVRQAREMVLGGELGEINAIRSCYIQGWLRTRLESDNQKQAAWRTDPSKSGIAGCFGDIGTHAYNLGRYITGLLPKEISCLLKTFAEGRKLDDYGVAAVRYENGALGTVTASQISHGRENDIFIEVDGTKAAIEWHQENPNQLFVRKNGEPHKVYTRAGGPYLGAAAAAATRIPSGHPEGYLEAFANIYTAAYDAMAKRASGQKFETTNTVYPNVYDGLEGMLFITQCVQSSKENGAWLPFKHPKLRK